ncbi:hypothetical protein [Burkholderia ubonensis]|uniref:hypothetical protein n=1 Tax=Burkholderia ubonensis TaxID=101571 RepID=UPI000A6CE278|nr:hypothetical protein [Burkholderia ubonensis]
MVPQPVGIILGSVPRSADLIRRSGPLADEFLSAAEESEFSGDPVETDPLASRLAATICPQLSSQSHTKPF